MAVEEVIVKIKANEGDYSIEETTPSGWIDMFRKFAAHDPLFLGVQIGQNLDEGILFKFEIE